MKYYIISGEASGDMHASKLMRELKKMDVQSDFRYWGGDLMQAQGGTLVKHYRDLAFMGFWEVLLNLKTILKNISFCKEDILNYQPDALILVDYPGFNLRIAKFAKQHNIPVYYYISPQVWAWKPARVHDIKRDVTRMFVILPFEQEFYQKYDYEVDFVGHPLIDSVREKLQEAFNCSEFCKDNNLDERKIVAILPGSRKQEISKMLPEMLKVMKRFPDYQFVVAAAPSIQAEFYASIIRDDSVKIVYNQTYKLFRCSEAAVVTSGTATLEAALMNVPELVCYKSTRFSYAIAKRLVKVAYISLVNLIMNKKVLNELIQTECNEESICKELQSILFDENYRLSMLNKFQKLRNMLGQESASEKTAQLIWQHLNRKAN